MTDHDDIVYVRHMLDSAREAVKISQRITRADLQPFSTETLALTRLLEIMGEAARRTSQAFRDRHSEIAWKQIAGTRDRLIHGYDRVDYDILWDTCTCDLQPLIAQLEEVLRREAGE
jgi:uncharacterized protein with HEPN domain